jgi:hypothetical protein
MSERLPNIVFITTDTQGRDMLSCVATHPGVSTPHLVALFPQLHSLQSMYVIPPVYAGAFGAVQRPSPPTATALDAAVCVRHAIANDVFRYLLDKEPVTE